jgi:hypothetical protein
VPMIISDVVVDLTAQGNLTKAFNYAFSFVNIGLHVTVCAHYLCLPQVWMFRLHPFHRRFWRLLFRRETIPTAEFIRVYNKLATEGFNAKVCLIDIRDNLLHPLAVVLWLAKKDQEARSAHDSLSGSELERTRKQLGKMMKRELDDIGDDETSTSTDTADTFPTVFKAAHRSTRFDGTETPQA